LASVEPAISIIVRKPYRIFVLILILLLVYAANLYHIFECYHFGSMN